MTTLPLSDVKARFSEIAEEVDRTHDRVLVTRNGREYVVVMSVEDLESMEATMELLADPAAQRRLRQSERDIAAGRVVDTDGLRAAIERRHGPRKK
jgi:prevent-host-death family protein